jgi:predicted ATPase
MARVVRGWALIGRGDDEHAAGEIREGLAAWQRTGAQLMRPQFLALLSEASAAGGAGEPGLGLLDEALAVARSTGERMYEGEICRLRGERLSRGVWKSAAVRTAEACFEQALAIAREQEALSLELRAASSLARFRRARGGHGAARDVLLPVYARFEEGFDTADLRDARSLLGRLNERGKATS